MSRTGAGDSVPLLRIFTNSGDSCSFSRSRTEKTTRTADSRKGIRQPQVANAASPSSIRQITTTRIDSRNPAVAVVCRKLVYVPLRSAGECSAT